MGELVRLVVEIVTLLWPFRIVEEWERAGYYINGKWRWECKPGLKVVIPWFCNVMPVSMAPGIIGTGRKDITLSDGSTLSFEATATVRVVDVQRALNSVEEFKETGLELLTSVLSERLADVDAERLSPDKRRRLLADIRRWVQEEADEFGLEFTKIRFTSFVQKVPTYRLLLEQSPTPQW